MKDIWFISDTHFNHKNILGFKGKDNRLIRPEFTNVKEMNETMIQNWNKTVKEFDLVYHLGDVYFGDHAEADKILKRLNGKKRLVLGNHDMIDRKSVLPYNFEKIMLWRLFKEFNFLCTHVPMLPDPSEYRKADFNIHGHIHEKVVYDASHSASVVPDPFYINVSVERVNYTPVSIDEIKAKTMKGK